MTKEEIKALIEELKTKGEDYTEELYAMLEQAKEQMDTETRRKLRIYWSIACAICLVIGYMAGSGLA